MFLNIKDHFSVRVPSSNCSCWAALWCYKNAATGLSPALGTFAFKGVQCVFSG